MLTAEMTTKIINRVNELTLLANEKYNLDLKFEIHFTLKGSSTAGMCDVVKIPKTKPKAYKNHIYFNPMFCAQHPNFTLNEIIPHELAHAYEKHLYRIKQPITIFTHNSHGIQWMRIARFLGATGRRSHNKLVVNPAKTYHFTELQGILNDIPREHYLKYYLKGKKIPTNKGIITPESKFLIISGEELVKQIKNKEFIIVNESMGLVNEEYLPETLDHIWSEIEEEESLDDDNTNEFGINIRTKNLKKDIKVS